MNIKLTFKKCTGLPGGAVVKNPPAIQGTPVRFPMSGFREVTHGRRATKPSCGNF